MKACVNCEGSGDDCFDPEKNPALRREIKLARRSLVPDNYIKRVIQFAKQGYKDINFDIYDTDWDSEAYLTVSGKNSNNSVSLKDDFLRAVETDVLPTCRRYGMGVITWGPLGGGWLSGRWRRGAEAIESGRRDRVPRRDDLARPASQRKPSPLEERAAHAEDAGPARVTARASADLELANTGLPPRGPHRFHDGPRGLLPHEERLHALGQGLLDRGREDHAGGAGRLELQELGIERILEGLHLVRDGLGADGAERPRHRRPRHSPGRRRRPLLRRRRAGDRDARDRARARRHRARRAQSLGPDRRGP